MPDEPTLGEIMRRLDEVARQMVALADRLDRQQEQAASTFVRRDVYAADRQLADAHVADIRHDLGAHATDIEANRRAWRDLDSKINDRFRAGVAMFIGSLLLPVAAGLVLWAATVRGGS